MQEQLAQDESPRAGVARPSGWKVARSVRYVTLLLLTIATTVVLGWFNRTPWWGWAIAMTVIVGLVFVLHRLRRRSALVRLGGWLLGTVVACATIVLAYPPPDTRAAGGGDPAPTQQVSTREGPVRGVVNDARTVEIFAGIPYARPPIGDLRWRSPAPPEARGDVFVADRFSAVPVQATSTFFTRTLSRVVDAPLEGTLLNPYRVSEDSLYPQHLAEHRAGIRRATRARVRSRRRLHDRFRRPAALRR